MTDYKFITDKIEIRSSTTGKEKEYIVKGFGVIPYKLDKYKFDPTPDGSFKTMKSYFTDNCLKSINSQAQAKKIFIDVEHKLALENNIHTYLNDMVSKSSVNLRDEANEIMSLFRSSDLPIAKCKSVELTDDGFIVDTRLNPAYAKQSPEHQNYFDAVWDSLQNESIKGISMNFKPILMVDETINGETVSRIDDVDLYGFSYTGQQALPENSIFEVSMRMALEKKEEFKQEPVAVQPVAQVNTVQDDSKVKELQSQVEAQAKQLETMNNEKIVAQEQAKEDQFKVMQDDLAAQKAKLAEFEQKRVNPNGSQAIPNTEQPTSLNKEEGLPLNDFKEVVSKMNMGEVLAAQFQNKKVCDEARMEKTSGYAGKTAGDIVISSRVNGQQVI